MTIWTQMPLPDEMLLLASSIDMSDDLVAISGVPYAEPPAGGDVADIGARVFVSGNQGATWSQAALDIEAARRDLGVDETVEFSRHFGLCVRRRRCGCGSGTHSAGRRVIACRCRTAWRPTRASLAGQSEGGSVRVWLDNRDGSETELRYSHDDLALTDSQKALLRDERDDPLHGGRVFLFSGEGGRTLVSRASYRGWASTGSAVDDGFRLILFTRRGRQSADIARRRVVERPSARPRLVRRRASPRRVRPRRHPVDCPILDHSSAEGSAARFTASRSASRVHRLHTSRVIEALGGLAVGDAGLVVGGFTALDGSDSATGQSMPDGRLNKDGYELRFNEPEGGITLWDLTAGETVYVFSAEAVQGTTEPPGVRTEGSGDFAMLTFEDPDTGEDLVSFSMVELFEVMGPPPPMAAGVPEQWVGWSRDGVRVGLGVSPGSVRPWRHGAPWPDSP